jgi:hypothetical protein
MRPFSLMCWSPDLGAGVPPATFVAPILEVKPEIPSDGGDLLRAVSGVSRSCTGV